MAFTYSGRPDESPKDALRFALSDTDALFPILQDEEIEYIIANNNTITKQLAAAYRHCANLFSKKPGRRQLGPQMEDTSQRQKYFSEMAEKYEKLLAYAGVPPTPAYEADKVFGKNMMVNE